MFVRKAGYPRSMETALAAQQQIQDEVEKNLRLPSVTTIEMLYELHGLRDLQRSSIAELRHRWSHCQLQPDYKDFARQWVRASSREIAGVQFRYALLYQERRILETILNLEEVTQNDTDRECSSVTPPKKQIESAFLTAGWLSATISKENKTE